MVKNLSVSEDKVLYDFRVGNPTEELLKIVIEENIDMVVMGIKSKNSMKYIFTGSVANHFFRRCPVTVAFYQNQENSEQLRKYFSKHIQ